MDANEVVRLARLERRVAALERRAGIVVPDGDDADASVASVAAVAAVAAPRRPVPVERSAPVARPPVARPPSPRPRPRASRPSVPARDLERFVGVSVLGRVGVAALLLAAGYFAQWGYVRIPVVARVLSIYGLAALLVATGAAVRRRVSPTYVAILWGGGTAVAYLAGVAARLRYDLVGPAAALGLLVGASALGDLLARRLRVQGLAVVALVGAAAAPLLVGSTTDARTMLLVYLLVVYGWGVALDAARGWREARIAGLCATVAVACVWALERGRLDVSTWSHLHAYLLGWTAPAWVPWLVRRTGPRRFPAALGVGLVLVEVALGVGSAAGTVELRRAFGAVVGVGWGLVAALALRTSAGVGTFHRWAARLAAAALIVGAVFTFQDQPSRWVDETLPVLLLAAVALAALYARPWVGVGDGAALAAAVVGLLPLALGGLRAPGLAVVAAILPGLALVVVGAKPHWRLLGLTVAALAAWASNDLTAARAGSFAPLWTYASLGGVACLAAVRGSRESGPRAALSAAAALLLGLVVGGWTLVALGRPFGEVTAPLVNPATLAGALLLGAAAFLARHAPPDGRARGVVHATLALAALAVVLVVVGREVRHATAPISARDVARTMQTGAFAVVALAMAVLAGRRASRVLPVAFGLAWLTALASAMAALSRSGSPWTAAAQVVLVALPPLVFSTARRQPDRVGSAAALTGLVGALLCFVQAWAKGRFGDPGVVVNARFASGALLVALMAWARSRASGVRQVLTVAAVLLSVVVAVPEVRTATGGLERLELQRALMSVYAALHAAAVLALGFLRRDRWLRWLALGGFGVVVLKVGILDLATAQTPVRVLVTGALGAVLLGAAYAYARRGKEAGPPDVER